MSLLRMPEALLAQVIDYLTWSVLSFRDREDVGTWGALAKLHKSFCWRRFVQEVDLGECEGDGAHTFLQNALATRWRGFERLRALHLGDVCARSTFTLPPRLESLTSHNDLPVDLAACSRQLRELHVFDFSGNDATLRAVVGPSLRELRISLCSSLRRIDLRSSCLWKLEMVSVEQLVALRLPATLTSLALMDCPQLVSLVFEGASRADELPDAKLFVYVHGCPKLSLEWPTHCHHVSVSLSSRLTLPVRCAGLQHLAVAWRDGHSWCQPLCELWRLARLRELSLCVDYFRECPSEEQNLSFLHELRALTTLRLRGLNVLSDAAWLVGMPELRHLTLATCGPTPCGLSYQVRTFGVLELHTTSVHPELHNALLRQCVLRARGQ